MALGLALFASGCGRTVPSLPVTPPAELCDDPSLTEADFCYPGARIAPMLDRQPFEVMNVQAAPEGTSAPSKVRLRFPSDGTIIQVKWKIAPEGGEGLNNQPRKELAAWAFQKLLMDDAAHVVPPTVMRCIPLDSMRQHFPDAEPTFDGTQCSFVMLAYWLQGVTWDDVWDEDRWASDPAYGNAIASTNLFTHLIDHRDSRKSNFLITKDRARPRVFAVDNGLAFSGLKNPIVVFYKDWGKVFVPAVPKTLVDRIRRLKDVDIETLATVAQYRIVEGQLVATTPGPAMSKTEGVRVSNDTVQLGLTDEEIERIKQRVRDVIRRVDRGELRTF